MLFCVVLVQNWFRVCLDWRWVWQNHRDTVILLKLQTVALVKIIVVHCDSDDFAAIQTWTSSVFRLTSGESKCLLVHNNNLLRWRKTCFRTRAYSKPNRLEIFTCFTSIWLWSQLLFYSLFCTALSQSWTALVNIYLNLS